MEVHESIANQTETWSFMKASPNLTGETFYIIVFMVTDLKTSLFRYDKSSFWW